MATQLAELGAQPRAIDWKLFEPHAERVLDTCNRLRSRSAARL